MLKLYYAFSVCSTASYIGLEESGAKFDSQALAFAKNEQRTPEYLKVNPRGRVPTLLVDDQPVTEVLAILTYLAHRYPHSELLPLADPLRLAKAYEVMSWFASTVHVAFAQIARPERYADDEVVKAALATPGEARFARTLTDIERLAQALESDFATRTIHVTESIRVERTRTRRSDHGSPVLDEHRAADREGQKENPGGDTQTRQDGTDLRRPVRAHRPVVGPVLNVFVRRLLERLIDGKRGRPPADPRAEDARGGGDRRNRRPLSSARRARVLSRIHAAELLHVFDCRRRQAPAVPRA